MTRDETTAFLPGTIACPTHLGAASYAVPTLDWLQAKCWPAFRSRLWSENLDKWIVRWECRDFARAFACFALECWATSALLPSLDDGLSVGEIWFRLTPTTGHAICPAITDQGLVFIEPQTGQLCTLTPEQLSSRYFLRF